MQGGWRFPRRTYQDGAHIVREGERGDEAFIIAEGRCAVYKQIDGEEKLVKELGPGEVFGEIAVFTSQPRSASVRAMGEVSVAIVTRKQFEEELGLGFWLKIFVRTLAERFRELDARATDLERRLAEKGG
jgi:CRP-like cAMP-binding protein